MNFLTYQLAVDRSENIFLHFRKFRNFSRSLSWSSLRFVQIFDPIKNRMTWQPNICLLKLAGSQGIFHIQGDLGKWTSPLILLHVFNPRAQSGGRRFLHVACRVIPASYQLGFLYFVGGMGKLKPIPGDTSKTFTRLPWTKSAKVNTHKIYFG